MRTREQQMVLNLHQKVRDWWKDAAKLESQGKKIPAASMRRRMQGIGWILRSIEREMGIDPLEMEETNGSESG